MDINNLISNFGFPVTCCMAMGFFIYKIVIKLLDKMWEKISTTLDKVTETNNQLVSTNQSLISNINSKVDVIENKVDEIAEKIK